ncbi:MAG: peptidoglycan DD-metalloendopeptidase family protein [Panacagrimonas sp.]|jgi:murein DD-endopeptidase MepM/ murein hydrolase activator NlpD|nr:M23 family metallopeptidase [Panacagrimonas sp.]MCC2655673.1 peptidoglycan DD-metalloendopeptidase family protein [Panacagrimonas sp.]
MNAARRARRTAIAAMLLAASGAAIAQSPTQPAVTLPLPDGVLSQPIAERLRPSLPLEVPVPQVSREDLVDSFDDRRETDRRHEALDIPAPRGTPVVAVDDGEVVKLFPSKPGGLTVYQFDRTRSVAYYYAHLDHYAEGLEEGRLVRRGEVLGAVGSTGNADPAVPHLHFGVFELGPERQWWKGRPIDPLPLLIGTSR